MGTASPLITPSELKTHKQGVDVTTFFGLKGRPIEELEDNLRKHLGIPPNVEPVEEEHAEDKLGLTFELRGSDQVNIIATSTRIISIALLIEVFDEDAADDVDDDEVFQSFRASLTEEEARDLFSDIEAKLPEFRARAIAAG